MEEKTLASMIVWATWDIYTSVLYYITPVSNGKTPTEKMDRVSSSTRSSEGDVEQPGVSPYPATLLQLRAIEFLDKEPGFFGSNWTKEPIFSSHEQQFKLSIPEIDPLYLYPYRTGRNPSSWGSLGLVKISPVSLQSIP
jgi:hypothetical protein